MSSALRPIAPAALLAALRDLLRQVLERVRTDPDGFEAALRLAEERKGREQRLIGVLDHRYVGGFLRNPAVRAEATELLSPEDIELLDRYLAPGGQLSSASPEFTMTLRQALDNARQGKSIPVGRL